MNVSVSCADLISVIVLCCIDIYNCCIPERPGNRYLIWAIVSVMPGIKYIVFTREQRPDTNASREILFAEPAARIQILQLALELRIQGSPGLRAPGIVVHCIRGAWAGYNRFLSEALMIQPTR